MKSNKKYIILMFLSIILLLVGAFLGLYLGAKEMPLSTVSDALYHYDGSLNHQLIRDLRLPRVLAAMMVGGILGLCGCLMQGVTRNPLAEPSLLGISQSSTLAISLLYCAPAYLTSHNIVLASLLGALIGGSIVMIFTMSKPSNMSLSRLLLAGNAMSTFFLSLSSIVGLLSNNSQLIGFLVGGGFRSVIWAQIPMLIVAATIGLGISVYLSPVFNTFSLGDEVSISLGVNPNRMRFYTLSLVIVLSAISVAVGKNISFVGLIIPQIAMRLVPNDFRYGIPASFVLGGCLLVYADLFSRMVISPYEIPISIFTSLFGVPFFLYLVRKESN